MQFKGVKIAKYDAIMKEMGLSDSNAKWPDGIISHVAGSAVDGMCVVDVLRSQADFDKVFVARLKPAFDKVGGGATTPSLVPVLSCLLDAHQCRTPERR